RPTSSINSCVRCLRSLFATPAISRGKLIFSSTVRDQSRLKCWKIIDTFCLFCRRSFLDYLLIVSSPMTMSPDDGSSRPFRRRISVDFPAPEYPMTPNISPLSICRLTSSTAVISADFVLLFLFTFKFSILDHLLYLFQLKN